MKVEIIYIIYHVFSKKFGVKPFCISEPGVDRGACILAGFESIKVPDVPFEESLDFIF